MDSLPFKIQISINDKIYLKNPESSELGRKVISSSIDLIDEIGYEKFTFKKLGIIIGSPESTIYRYFESKHRLLLYLFTWYWGWLEFRLLFSIGNIKKPKDKLIEAIRILTGSIHEDDIFSHVNEIKLNQIIITESSKVYHTREVDAENKEGCYIVYKRLVGRVSDVILEINPTYKHPHTLVSTIIEGAQHQKYFAEHLPKLTDVKNPKDDITIFYTELVLKMIDT
ncbi:MAG: TetR/AcrR family transcriptional regulator [Crocinitomicaceae bacterium]|nr:TetR/AcrR family transcriptional regulator [Crocinitomicaceae bacterium]